MNPMNVAQARTARLAREASVRVAYSTKTGDRPGYTRPEFRQEARDADILWDRAHECCVHSIGYCDFYE